MPKLLHNSDKEIEITEPQPPELLPWLQELVDIINKEPGHHAHIEEREFKLPSGGYRKGGTVKRLTVLRTIPEGYETQAKKKVF